MEQPDVEALLEKDLDELYADIGRKLAGLTPEIENELAGFLGVPPNIQELADVGRRWLRSRRDELAAAICPNKRIKQIQEIYDLSKRRAQLVIAIENLIKDLLNACKSEVQHA